MKKENFLVTGAAGFIGAAVAAYLLRQGHSVVTIDNLSTGNKKNLPEGIEFLQGDCQSGAIIEKLENRQFEAIFHIAGQSSGEISYDNPVYDLQTNAQSTLQLLQLANKIGCKKFIYASTMSVYGNQPDVAVKESFSTVPLSFYGVGKLASEHYLRIYHNQYGINSVALRLFNVYGPGQNMENLRQGMVSIFLAQAMADNAIHVKGSKDRFRDFVYIDDVVSAFISAWQKMPGGTLIANVGSGKKTTVETLVSGIMRQMHEEVRVKYEGSTPGDQFGIFADMSVMKDKFGWTPQIDLNEGLQRMVSWARQKT